MPADVDPSDPQGAVQAGAAPSSPTAFLSYAHHDVVAARRLIGAFHQSGVSVWWDEMLPAGATFATNVEEALNGADAVVVLWSKASVLSDWVRDEAAVGRARHCLVPVAIEGVAPPLGFGQYHATDLSGWNGRADDPAFESILSAIRHLARGGGVPLPASTTSSSAATGVHAPRLSRRGLIAAGAAAAALGIGGLAWRAYEDRPPSDEATAVRRIAVLPFANVGGDPGQAYFSDGLTEELRNALAQNPQIQVIAQTSSNKLKDDMRDPVSVARRLNVGHLVSGSVRRAEELVRIVVQLIDGTTGIISWSKTFEHKMSEIFAIEDEIARTVAGALQVTLLNQGGNTVRGRGGTDNVAAYDAYLRGVQAYDLSTSEETDREALAAFDQALKLDPDYAAGYAAKARVLTAMANSATSHDRMQALYAEALTAAYKAVELAPNFAGGWADLGYTVLHARLDVAAAAGPYQRAVDMGVGNADILSGYATFALRTGDFAKARDAIAKAIELDPLNVYAFLTAGNIEFSARRYPQALQQYRKALSLSPEMRIARGYIGDVLLMKGDLTGAKREYLAESERLLSLRGLGVLAARQRDRAGVDSALAALVEDYGDNGLYQQAEVLAQDGQVERALDALEKARAAGDSGMTMARSDPFLDPLQKSGRFEDLLGKMGFNRRIS